MDSARVKGNKYENTTVFNIKKLKIFIKMFNICSSAAILQLRVFLKLEILDQLQTYNNN